MQGHPFINNQPEVTIMKDDNTNLKCFPMAK